MRINVKIAATVLGGIGFIASDTELHASASASPTWPADEQQRRQK